jgi:hypothetical protein
MSVHSNRTSVPHLTLIHHPEAGRDSLADPPSRHAEALKKINAKLEQAEKDAHSPGWWRWLREALKGRAK